MLIINRLKDLIVLTIDLRLAYLELLNPIIGKKVITYSVYKLELLLGLFT